MRKLELSTVLQSDRIIGFTIPNGDTFYICDHDEVWKVTIGTELRVEVTDYPPYEFVAGTTGFLGLVLSGLTANSPLLRVGENEIAYDFDPKSDLVRIRCKVGSQSRRLEFRILSGDWFAASLSDNGRYLVLAEPYDIAVYALG